MNHSLVDMLLTCVLLLLCISLLTGCGVLVVEPRDNDLPDVSIDTEWCDKNRVRVRSGEISVSCEIQL